MSQEKDLCPISDNGNHRYFIFKAVEVFEPTDVEADSGGVLYEKKSLVISGCNCGASLSQVVPIK